MQMRYSPGRISASLLVPVLLILVLALVIIGVRFRGTGPGLQDYVRNLARKVDLLSNMRINLIKSEEAEKSAVMADTDEASQDFADQSRQAAQLVNRDVGELDGLITRDHTDQEMKLFREFDACWTELSSIDKVILNFAVQNSNLKASALSFTKGREAIDRFEHSLKDLIQLSASSGNCCRIVVLASDALAAGLAIQSLHAPHIAATSDEQMDAIEAEVRRDEETIDVTLKELVNLAPAESRKMVQEAREAYRQFAAVTAEVIKLSRQNTNIKSFELSLGKKRKMAAQCDEILTSLQEAVRSKEFKATR